MSLLDQLRDIENFPPSHQPSQSEIGELVGKLVAFAEYGEELFKAVDADVKARDAGESATNVDELLSPSPPPDQEGPSPAAAPSTAPGAGEDLAAENAALRQQLATLQAQQQRTEVTTDPPVSDVPPPAGPAV